MATMTRAELLALPPTVSLTTAARALGIGRTTAYTLAHHDRFPCRILRVGTRFKVPTSDLLVILGITAGSSPTNATAETSTS